MDNEAPNYASWIPEAGGYVANGKVVSKSPVYDANGKLKLDVDTSVFGTALQAQPQSQGIQPVAQPEVAVSNNPLSGITTSNTEGSGEDANWGMTQAGALASLNNNTENTEIGPLNTPATQSNIAEEPAGSPLEEAQKRYQQYVATNNLQGQINELTTIGNLTGVDYSTQIAQLTKDRQRKIQNIDDDYSSQIATAQMLGDTEKVMALKEEQAKWRKSVGYQDAMNQKFETAQQELDLDYQTTYMQSVNDITNMLMQALPGILNFQYNPYQDTALQMAQGYATSKVKEQMNLTGMYYSSMTQNAITKAVAELVPVYEKMAREEAIQNFQLLQQTASFLVDLEQAQFNLWKGQLDVKFQANADKRAEIAAAWDRVNEIGYVDNEASAILGVPAGTESYATRKAYTDKLNQIDMLDRQLEQDKALAEFNNGLQIQRMEKQSEIDLEEYRQKAEIDYGYNIATIREQSRLSGKNGSGGNGSEEDTASTGGRTFEDATVQEKYDSAVANKSLNEAIKLLYDKDVSDNDKFDIAEGILEDILIPNIDTYQDMFKSGDKKSTKSGVNAAIADINQFISGLEKFDVSTEYKRDVISRAYSRLFDNIDTASGFDWGKGDKSTETAKNEIINNLRNDKSKPEYVTTWVPAVLVRKLSPLDDVETAQKEATNKASAEEQARIREKNMKDLTTAADFGKKAMNSSTITGAKLNAAAAAASLIKGLTSMNPITYGKNNKK